MRGELVFRQGNTSFEAGLAGAGFDLEGAAGGRGSVVQDGGDLYASSISMAQDVVTSTGSYTINGGTVTLASFLQIGRLGSATFTQNGGTVSLNRTTDSPLYIGGQTGMNATSSASGTYNLNGGVLNCNNYYATIGRESRAYGTLNVSGSGVASFRSGLIVGMKDNSGGEINQTGGVVNVATGLNQNLGEDLPGGRYKDVGLVLGMNIAWTDNG